ncbi:MAG: hypothetical protein V4488_13895 [Pseudomonadota bacterium]
MRCGDAKICRNQARIAIVKTKTIDMIKACAVFFLALILSACGGGGSGSQVTSLCSQTNVSACGGGGGLSGGGSTPGGTTATTPKMALTLTDQAGNPASLLTSSSTLTATVKVTNASGQPVSGAVVLFNVANSGLAKISPASNLSDANGMALATVTLAAPDAVGATTISASTSYPDSAGAIISLASSANIKVGNVQNAPQSILLVSISPADKAILLQGNTGGGRVQTAQVTFKITDLNGLAVANQKVKFAFQQAPVDLTFAADTGVSGQDGNVTAIVNSGNTVTVVTVIVTVVDQSGNPVLNRNGLPITATSDQITVTNTVLSPNGISLAQDKFAIEGWDVDGDSSTITARLTDLQGGQITDGTAVTFTTDGGAITGESNSAKCTSKDGACSVKLVGQNPRPAGGIAHVIASLQLNGVIVTRDVFVAMSGSVPVFSGNFLIDFSNPATCDTRTVTFTLSDMRTNIMPEGSALSIQGALNAGVAIVNPAVKYPGYIVGSTAHLLQVTPGGQIACSATGTRIVEGSFYLVLTTPHNHETWSQPVIVRYRAN